MIGSWVKLHNSYPNDIPSPTYKDGKSVYQSVTANGKHAVAAGQKC